MNELMTDAELIHIAKDQHAYMNVLSDAPALRFGRAVEAVISLRYEEMISELEREIRMVRERVKRLEAEQGS